MSKKICHKCGSEMRPGIYHKEGDRRDGEKGWRCISPKCGSFVFDEIKPLQES